MRFRAHERVLVATLSITAAALFGCESSTVNPANSGNSAGAGAASGTAGSGTAGGTSGSSGTAGSGTSGGSGTGGASGGVNAKFNQCGVAAPLPANPGQCTLV